MSSKLSFNNFLVDRLILKIYNFKIESVSQTQFQQIDQALHNGDFSRINQGKSFVTYKLRSRYGLRGDATIRYSHQSESTHLTMKLDFNPTKMIRAIYSQEFHKSFPKSLDGKDNFIPSDIVKLISLKRIHSDNIIAIKDTVNGLIDHITTIVYRVTGSKALLISQPIASIQSIEIYFDEYCDNGLLNLKTQENNFQLFFKSYHKDKYTTYNSIGIESNSPYLKGSNYKGECHKVYAKGLSTIRYETTYIRSRIQKLLGSNRIDLSSSESIVSFLEPLSKLSQTTFNQIILDRNALVSSSKLYCLLYHLARSCPNEKLFEDLTNIMLTNNRICSGGEFNYTIHRLNKKGFLKRVGRGIYSILLSRKYVKSALSNMKKLNELKK
ncbi:MAG: hypothetical protein GY853_15430 [PVC group bacterium]|nr:hypothetical protein [PVC group bacterium]